MTIALLELLALIHSDGGHHTDAVGIKQSLVDAEQALYRWRAAYDELALVEYERNVLRSFANDVMEVWPDSDLDGGTLQEYAEKYGLLRLEMRNAPCKDDCKCATVCDDEDFELGVTCYRMTALLTGPNKPTEELLPQILGTEES